MSPAAQLPIAIGRYAIYDEIAAGGMASVHVGRLIGPVGFSRTVAIKRLHPQMAKDREFTAMFLDEARVAAHVRHPNVVPTLDVVEIDKEVFLVMEYVHGASFVRLLRAAREAGEPVPRDIVSTILCGVLHGLHAAHEARDERGGPLHIVHRDVSPQNVLVGVDGVPRVLDFGIAKAAGRMQATRDGKIKGKLSYMAPEQLRAGDVDRRTDVYAAGVVLWESLTLQRLFVGDSEGMIVNRVLERIIEPPSVLAADVSTELDELTMRALDRDQTKRFQTARDMALALEKAVPLASATRVAHWVDGLVGEELAGRAQSISKIEHEPSAPLRQAVAAAEAAVGGSGVFSQVSNLSLPTSPPAAPAPSRRWPWVALAACIGAGAAYGSIALRHGRHWESPITDRSGSPASPLSAAPSPSAPVPSATVAPAAPLATADDAAPPASAAHSAVAQSAAPTSTRRYVHVAPPPPVRSAEKPCPIRSYIDDAGIKHFVRDCQ